MTDKPESRSLTTISPAASRTRVSPGKQPLTPMQQRLRRFRRNRFWLLLFLWVASILPELVLRAATSGSGRAFFNSGLILSLLLALVPALAVFILCTAIPSPKANRRVSLLYTGSLFLLHSSQLLYFRASGTFYTLRSPADSPGLLLEGIHSMGKPETLIPILLAALPFLVLLLWGSALFSFKPLKAWKNHIPMAAACVLIQCLTVLCLPLFGGTGIHSPYGLYHHSSDPCLSVNRLGMLTTFRLEIRRSLAGASRSASLSPESVPESQPASEPSPPAPSVGQEHSIPTANGFNLLDLDFEALAEQENRDAVAQIHQWFSGRTPSQKNSKTGLFKGCNLILIQAEAFRHQEISQELTPALYRLSENSFLFSDYYAPDWGVYDSDDAYALLSGTVPKNGEWSFDAAVGNHMPLTMVQQLLSREYRAWSFHTCSTGSCGRLRYLEELGYECFGCRTGAAPDLFDQMSAYYRIGSPFTIFCSIEDQQGIRELDQGLQVLMARLDHGDILDNTVILLTSGSSGNQSPEECLGSCMIWKAGLTPESINTPASPLDLLPTLSNLFGLEFDSRLYMGRDVFSAAQPLVLFRNHSWITDQACYNAETGLITSRSGQPPDNTYAESIHREVQNRFIISELILDYDYWRILFS